MTLRSYGGTAAFSHFVVGLHFAPAGQFSALAVIEQKIRRVGPYVAETEALHLRHLEHLPPGTAFRDAAARVHAVVAAVAEAEADDMTDVVVSVGDVGRAPLQFLDGAQVRALSVTMTSANAEGEIEQDHWRLGRNDLVGGLVVAVEGGRLQVAKGLDLADVFNAQLSDFRRRPMTGAADATSGPAQVDELVVAAGLAVWRTADHVPMQGPTSYVPPLYADA